MAESYQKKLKRVRPPRVQITYDVEVGGAMEKRELPFVVGVLGDFSGDPTKELEPFENRKFIEIDRDNFDEVMSRMTPGATFRVENTLAGDGSELGVQLQFNSIEDFEPANVVKQVEPLRKLLEMRNKLRDLDTKSNNSPKLEKLLEKALEETGDMEKLAQELGVDPAADQADSDGRVSEGPEKEDDQ